MNLVEINSKIKDSLNELYEEEPSLFRGEKSLCERCINHRFAWYLEKQNFGEGYFVDCEYNKTYLGDSKRVSNSNGNYIDIVISKRDDNPDHDLICFEVKKWNNYKNREKDRKNLEILTNGTEFYYNYGFYVIFGKTREKTQIKTYERTINQT